MWKHRTRNQRSAWMWTGCVLRAQFRPSPEGKARKLILERQSRGTIADSCVAQIHAGAAGCGAPAAPAVRRGLTRHFSDSYAACASAQTRSASGSLPLARALWRPSRLLLLGRPLQLNTIERLHRPIDQLTRDIRDVASVDLILQTFQRGTAMPGPGGATSAYRA